MRFFSLFFSLICLSQGLACSGDPLTGTDYRTGKAVSVDPKQGGKGTVVLFLSAKCPCSKSHEGTIEALAKEFPDFKFVGIHSNVDEAQATSLAHFAQSGLSFPVLRDPSAAIATRFGAFKTPHAFIVTPNGECAFSGGVDNSADAERASKHYLKEALVDLKEGREPRQKKVRALGCAIRRS